MTRGVTEKPIVNVQQINQAPNIAPPAGNVRVLPGANNIVRTDGFTPSASGPGQVFQGFGPNSPGIPGTPSAANPYAAPLSQDLLPGGSAQRLLGSQAGAVGNQVLQAFREIFAVTPGAANVSLNTGLIALGMAAFPNLISYVIQEGTKITAGNGDVARYNVNGRPTSLITGSAATAGLYSLNPIQNFENPVAKQFQAIQAAVNQIQLMGPDAYGALVAETLGQFGVTITPQQSAQLFSAARQNNPELARELAAQAPVIEAQNKLYESYGSGKKEQQESLLKTDRFKEPKVG